MGWIQAVRVVASDLGRIYGFKVISTNFDNDIASIQVSSKDGAQTIGRALKDRGFQEICIRQQKDESFVVRGDLPKNSDPEADGCAP